MIRSKTRKLLSLTALVLFIFALIFLSVNYNVKFGSLTGQVISEINAPEEEASIRFVIPITGAEHLDENKDFVSDVYEELKDLDNIWSEPIYSGEYVRVTFEQNLTNENDITIYPRILTGSPRIEVYEVGGSELIAEFTNLISNDYNGVFLTSLQGSQDVFNLRVVGGSVEFDHIFDARTLTSTSMTANDTTINEGDQITATGVYDTPGTGGAGDWVFGINETNSGRNIDATCSVGDVFQVISTDTTSCTQAGGETCSADGNGVVTASLKSTGHTVIWTIQACSGSSDLSPEDVTTYQVSGDAVSFTHSTGSITINAADSEPPQFSTLTETPSDPATYSFSQTYEFNSTWTDDTAVDVVIIEFDGVNSTVALASGTAQDGVYRFTRSLSAGSYNYYWYANDTAGNSNATSTQSYTINKATPTGTITGTSPITYGTAADIQGTESNSGDGDVTYTLYRNSVAVSNPDTSTLGAGTYNYVFNSTSGTNYSAVASLDTFALTVNQATPSLNLQITNATYPNNGTINASESNNGDGDLTYNLYIDEVFETSGSTIDIFKHLSAGTYNITYNTTGGTNYTSGTSSTLLTIFQGTPAGTISLNPSATETYPTETTATGSESNQGDSDVTYTLFRDDVAVSNPEIATLAAGSYTYKFNSTSGTNWTAVASMDSEVLTINKGTSVVNTFLNNARANITIETGTEIYLNVTQITGDSGATLRLYDNGTLINQGSSPLSNLTIFSTEGEFNITGFYLESENYTSSSEQWNVTVNPLDTPPKWSNPVVDDSTPDPGQTVIHNVTWTDDNALSYATLEVNSSGASCNTPLNVSNMVLSGTSQVANLSWTVENACEGKTIGWRQYANDSEGQWNVTDLQTYTVNNIAPIASFGTNPMNFLNSSSGTITFDLKGSDNLGISTLQLYGNWSGSFVANQTNSSPVNDTFWNVTVTGIPEGRNHIWAAWVNDTAGNEDFTDTNRTFTVDLTNPTSVINAPGNNTWTTDTTPDINVTVTDNFDNSITTNIYLNGSLNKTQAVSNNTATNITLSDPLPDGLWLIIAEAVDDSERRTNSSTLYLTVDTISPTVTLPVYTNATEKRSSDSLILNISVSDANTVGTSCLVNVAGQGSNTTIAYSSGWCNGTISLTGSSEGNSIISAYANDSAGNLGLNDSYVVRIDDTAPTVTLPVYTNATMRRNDQSLTLNISVSDSGVGVDRCTINIATSSTGNVTVTPSSGWCNTTYALTGASDGNQTINAYANDTLGNLALNNSYVVQMDSTNPTSTINAPGNNTWTTDNTPDINITMTDNIDSSITYNIYTNDSINKTGSVSNNTATNVTLDAQPEGLRLIIAEAVDDAGNRFNSSTLYLKIDSTIPQIQFVAPTENNASTKSRTWIFANVTITETNFQNVTFKLFNSTGLLNETTFTDSTRIINWTGLDNNNILYWYNVSTYDTSGNFNQTETRYITLSQDNPPTVTIIYPQSITYNVDVSELNYTAEDDASLSACWYSLDEGATNSSPDITCSNFTGLTSDEGSNTWIVYANDTSGNENSSSVTFSKDTTFPQFTNFQRNPDPPNEDQNFQANVTVTEANKDKVIFEFNATANYTVTTSNGDEYYFTINSGNYTAHDSVTYYWYANDTANNLNKSSQQDFTVANQAPTVSEPAINDTTPETNDLISCNGGTFSDSDAEDTEQNRYFKWYDDDTEISGQISQTLDLSISGLDKTDVIKCSIRVYDGYDNSSWTNSSNTATIQNSAPSITNPQTTVSWNANGSAYNYDYEATDPDSGDSFTWYDNTTLFNINSGTGVISDSPAEAEAGTYAIRISVSDGTVNTTDDFTYTINDVISPQIIIIYPQNTDYTVNVSQLNFTYTETNPDKCWYSKDSGVTNLSAQSCTSNFTNVISTEDSNTWIVYINDTSGNENSSSVTFNKDTAAPAVTINSPLSQNYSTTSITFNITSTDGGGVSSCLYSLDDGATNYSLTNSAGNFWTDTNSTMIQGSHTVNYYCNDTSNNWNLSEEVTFFIDSIYPLISFATGTEDNDTTHARNWIFANVSVTETNEDTITFSLYNSTSLVNQTGYTDSIRTINWTSLPNENYRYNVSVNDTAGNTNSTGTRYITLDTEGPSVSGLTESPADPATYSESTIYQFNATITDPSLDTVVFEFDSVNYTPSSSGNVYTTSLTNISVGNYNYRWYANDTFGNMNSTESGSYTVSQATPSLGLTITPSSSETYGTQTTATGSNCPSQLTCNLYKDGGSISNPHTAILGVAVYNYTYNTTGNTNYTAYTNTTNLTISQDTGACDVLFNETSPITYENAFVVWSNCDSAFTLYRNGTSITNNSVQSLGVSAYNFTIIRADSSNYSNVYDEETFAVQKATGVVFTYLDNSRANKTIEQFTEIYLNSTLETGSGNIKLYNNGTLINQGAGLLSNLTNFTAVGLYNITTAYDGNENYTSASEIWWVNVTEVDTTPPQISIIYPTNASYSSVQEQLNYSATDNIGLDTCWYSTDNGATNTTITCGQNVSGLNSGQGSSTWVVYANDSRGNENSSSVTFFVDSINPGISFVSPTETSGDSLTRNYIQINVTASDTNLDTITIRLYDSTSLVQTNTSATSPFFINYTGLSAGTYFFNATANDTLGNENSTSTRNVSLVVPSLTIIKPENKTYISNKNLHLKYIAAYENYVWYNLNQTGANTTITENTTFDTISGLHTLYLYANNSNGETSDSITFSVNGSKFRVIYSDYANSNKGSSTDFNKSSHEDLQDLSGIVFENTNWGKIRFYEGINVTDDEDATDNEIDLDTHINISENRIKINSTALPNFNTSATIYLYNLALDDPRILRDNETCPSTICTEIDYTEGTLVFNITQFTVYSADETPAAPAQQPSGGGGGGANRPGPVPECTENSDCSDDEICLSGRCVKLFDIKIIDFESPATLGDFFDFTYFIKGMADINNEVEISFWIEKEGRIVTSGSDVIYMGSSEEKTETTKIFLPKETESGIYKFFVKISYGSYSVSSHRTIEIEVGEGGLAQIAPRGEFGMPIEVIIAIIILLLAFAGGGKPSEEIWNQRRERKRSDIYEVLDFLKTKIERENPQHDFFKKTQKYSGMEEPPKKTFSRIKEAKKAEEESAKEKPAIPEKEKIQGIPSKPKQPAQKKPTKEKPEEKIDKIKQENEKSLEELFGIIDKMDIREARKKEADDKKRTINKKEIDNKKENLDIIEDIAKKEKQENK